MTKLFITLYLVVLASFGLFFVFLVSLDGLEGILSGSKNIERRLTKGSFMLMDRSIEGLTQLQVEHIVSQHKKVFDPFLGLLELSKLELDKDEIERLKNGEIVGSDNEVDSLKNEYKNNDGHTADEVDLYYKKIPDSNWVWRINLDTEVNQSVHNFTITTEVGLGRFSYGMHYLLHTYLLNENQDEWSQMVKSLEDDYGFPLSVHEESKLLVTLGKNKETLSRISKGEPVNISQESDRAIIVQRIADSSKVLQIGPIMIPWIIRHVVQLALLGFVLSIATVLFLWVRPFWSNLIKIKQAADEFGSGNYSARVPYKKRSQIAEIAQAFNAMAERTQHSIRSHKELTTAVSHELRTPVARMRFALEMLSATDDHSDQQRYVNDINEDIDELDSLLEELLSYARFDQQDSTLKLSKERLIPWITTSMERLMPLAKIKNKRLNYQIINISSDEVAQIEARLMSRVLDNLVQNGLCYAKQRVDVTLSKDEDSYLLVVEDDGKGIPKTEHEHIFDAFSRIDVSRDRASGGFGLGLAIADRIVKGHQGGISIGDSSLGGARFEVRFPVFSTQ